MDNAALDRNSTALRQSGGGNNEKVSNAYKCTKQQSSSLLLVPKTPDVLKL